MKKLSWERFSVIKTINCFQKNPNMTLSKKEKRKKTIFNGRWDVDNTHGGAEVKTHSAISPFCQYFFNWRMKCTMSRFSGLGYYKGFTSLIFFLYLNNIWFRIVVFDMYTWCHIWVTQKLCVWLSFQSFLQRPFLFTWVHF